MERIAEALGMDPVDAARASTRSRPATRPRPARRSRDDAARSSVLDEAVRRTDFRRKRDEYRGTNKAIGLALFYHGAGFTGSGERHLNSKARLDLTPTGVRIAVGSTEIGQGTRTMHAQIVADALGIPYESVEVAQPDTSRRRRQRTDGRVAHVHGRRQDSRGVRARHARDDSATLTPADYFAEHGAFIVERTYEPPDWIEWDDDTYRGDAYATYAWGCDVAELEVDPRHVRGAPDQVHRGAGVRSPDSSRARARTDRRRNRAGTRLRAARARRDEERRDGQRAAHELRRFPRRSTRRRWTS